jgi:hypothetical protein
MHVSEETCPADREYFDPLDAELRTLVDHDLVVLISDIDAAGAPWTPRWPSLRRRGPARR